MITDDNVSAFKPVSIVAIGAGNRMKTYSHYIELHPDQVKLVAVVECDDIRRNEMGEHFHILQENRFNNYDDFFKKPVPADAVIICTPDNEHFRPCMLAIKYGYHVLLEKPIAQSMEQCLEIKEAAKKANVIVCVCHVMRYHPCFIKIKEILDSGELGKIISINHIEGVGIDRTTHSYVRGIWNRKEISNPMLLAKCCHDVDFLLWITNSCCHKLSSFGSLKWFKKENAPKGSALRCIDCKVESKCPYSAVDLYLKRHDWISNFNIPKGLSLDDVIMKELEKGRLGRCVYHCDNDVVDHQILMMELEDGTTISLSMDIFTLNDHRKINIKLSEGEIECDELKLLVTHFREQKTEIFDFSDIMAKPYHGGADLKIMEEFIQAVRGKIKKLPSLVDDSIESHRICFEGEKSRITGKTITLH